MLRVRDGGQRLAGADGDGGRAPDAHGALQQAQLADVRQNDRGVAERRRQQPAGKAPLPVLLGRGLAAVGHVAREQLRPVRAGGCPWNDREQQRGARFERLVADVARGGLGERGGRACVRQRQVVGQLARVAAELAVDLAAQLSRGAPIDDQEEDGRAD